MTAHVSTNYIPNLPVLLSLLMALLHVSLAGSAVVSAVSPLNQLLSQISWRTMSSSLCKHKSEKSAQPVYNTCPLSPLVLDPHAFPQVTSKQEESKNSAFSHKSLVEHTCGSTNNNLSAGAKSLNYPPFQNKTNSL